MAGRSEGSRPPAPAAREPVRRVTLLAAIVALSIPWPSLAQPAENREVRPDLGRHFERFAVEGAFATYDLATGHWTRYNPQRSSTRLVPASTFKIFHSLVALETGVIADDGEVIPWDGVDRGSAAWNRDQTLRTAFRRSAVWAYQRLARGIGESRMVEWLRGEGYGSGDIGEAIDTFWLDGPLRISADEQVEFLRRLFLGELGFSEKSMAIVRDIMVVGETPGYTIRAKTGWAAPVDEEGTSIGWLVGWVERETGPVFFALNLETGDPDFPMRRAREEIACGILRELGALPASGAPPGVRVPIEPEARPEGGSGALCEPRSAPAALQP